MTKNYSFIPLLIDEKIFLVKEKIILHVEAPVVAEEPPKSEPSKLAPIAFQGKNNKQVVIVVNNLNAEYVTVEQELLLRNILTAMNLNLQDIALVNMAHMERKLDLEALGQIGCKTFIGFALDSGKISVGKDLVLNQLVENSGIRFLLSFGLDELQTDREKKMTLWRNLKTMFNL